MRKVPNKFADIVGSIRGDDHDVVRSLGYQWRNNDNQVVAHRPTRYKRNEISSDRDSDRPKRCSKPIGRVKDRLTESTIAVSTTGLHVTRTVHILIMYDAKTWLMPGAEV